MTFGSLCDFIGAAYLGPMPTSPIRLLPLDDELVAYPAIITAVRKILWITFTVSGSDNKIGWIFNHVGCATCKLDKLLVHSGNMLDPLIRTASQAPNLHDTFNFVSASEAMQIFA